MLLLSGGIVGCRERPRAVMANESLRLTPEQIATAEKEAASGDAAAAKRLWHHYTFVAGDRKKGETWKATYEKLSQGSADSK
jgi:hypothetical protein